MEAKRDFLARAGTQVIDQLQEKQNFGFGEMPVVFSASNKTNLSTTHVSSSAYREKGGSPGISPLLS